MTYSATYSPDDNKLRLYAVGRLDAETYARVRAAGFRWAPKQELWVAPMWTPEREDLLLELAGEIDDEDKTLAERAEERAERFTGYRANRERDYESAHKSVKAIADHIPLGQPILVGHHSERRARKDAERIENGMRRAVKMWKTAEYWKYRAAGAIAHASYKERPTVRARRIKGLEADRRKQLRYVDEAKKRIAAWGTLNTLTTDEARLARAIAIANLSYHSATYSGLKDGTLSPRAAQLRNLKMNARTIQHAERWIAHYDNRLTYEKAMLEDQGASALIAPQPPRKSAKSMLPLCNYLAPEGITVLNRWRAGETLHLKQITMTKAEYAKVYQDYRGTYAVEHSHRVRSLSRAGGLYVVFLSDAKVHPKPAAQEAPAPRAPRATVVVPGITEPVKSEPTPAGLAEMTAALKAGVQVVSAPALFPTPADLARQVVALADVRGEHRVLEPSAGTGALLEPLPPAAMVTAVELNAGLASGLQRRFPAILVRQGDFLEMTPEQLGTFDRIVMNPPFTNGADIRHIEHARRFLRPGGRLVAICAAGPRQREALAPLGSWTDLPAGSFAAQGTNVNTAIVVLEAAASQAA